LSPVAAGPQSLPESKPDKKSRAKSALHAQATEARRIVDWENAGEFARKTLRLYCRLHKSIFPIAKITATALFLTCGCSRETFKKTDPLSNTVTRSRRKTPPVFFEETESEAEST
jgi:hypothetical protein